MGNSKRQIDETTPPEIAQVIMAERMDEMAYDIKNIFKELRESREPLAVVKFLIAGFWVVLTMSITALIKVFTIKSGGG